MDGSTSPKTTVWSKEEFIRRYRIYYDATEADAEKFVPDYYRKYEKTGELPFFFIRAR